MLKDKFLHDKLGIPLQTLQNWKKSDGYTSLLYHYLRHQDKDKFVTDVEGVASFYKYDLISPLEFSKLIEKNWDKFDIFKDYTLTLPSETNSTNGEEQSNLLALKTDQSKQILVVRFVYALSKRKTQFFKEVDDIISGITIDSHELDTPKIIYVTSTTTEPAYFSDLNHDVSMINYSELYKIISDKKILTV